MSLAKKGKESKAGPRLKMSDVLHENFMGGQNGCIIGVTMESPA